MTQDNQNGSTLTDKKFRWLLERGNINKTTATTGNFLTCYSRFDGSICFCMSLKSIKIVWQSSKQMS